MESEALTIEGLVAGYGAVRALDGVSMHVRAGETVALLGANGNGKSTLLHCLLGLVRPWQGAVRAKIGGRTANLKPSSRRKSSRSALSWSRKAGGCSAISASRTTWRSAHIDRWRASAMPKILRAATNCFRACANGDASASAAMSGGEQQMVALGRAVMAAPEILLIDEPSVGLAPILVRQTFDAIADLKRRLGLTVLMAEQNLAQAIRVVDRGYVLAHGRIAFEGRSAAELSDNPIVRDIYHGALDGCMAFDFRPHPLSRSRLHDHFPRDDAAGLIYG